MTERILDLQKPEHAYFFGMLQTDGSIYETTQNRSKVSIELNCRDKEILNFFDVMLPLKSSLSNRERTTNFGFSSTSTLSIRNRAFTDELKMLGVPAGKKSELIKSPTVKYSVIDYWRGIIDGDGSLGLTAQGFPFVSLVTKSDGLSNDYKKLIEEVTGKKKKDERNKRDNVFNISLFKEPAQQLIRYLYYPGCVCLNRKRESADKALKWKLPLP